VHSIYQLLEIADLNILDYNIETRRELDNNGRIFPFYVMSYLQEGSATLRLDGKEYEAQTGDIVLVPPFAPHDHFKKTNDKTVFLWWHFEFKIASTIDVVKLLQMPVMAQLQQRAYFETVFSRFYEISKQGGGLKNVLLKRAHAMELMAVIIDELFSSEKIIDAVKVPEVFTQILYDVANLQEHDLTLAGLAQKYYMNPSYLSSQFKKLFGSSPITMRKNVQFEKARIMLHSSNLTVTEIAAALGFQDIYQFTRFFTAREGVSPTAYRNRSYEG